VPSFNQFFQGAAENNLAADPAMQANLVRQLEMLTRQRKALENVIQTSGVMGQDLSSLAPLMTELFMRQAKIAQSLGPQALLPTTAVTPEINIPQPTLPMVR
jgi:hypothetical protein